MTCKIRASNMIMYFETPSCGLMLTTAYGQSCSTHSRLASMASATVAITGTGCVLTGWNVHTRILREEAIRLEAVNKTNNTIRLETVNKTNNMINTPIRLEAVNKTNNMINTPSRNHVQLETRQCSTTYVYASKSNAAQPTSKQAQAMQHNLIELHEIN